VEPVERKGRPPQHIWAPQLGGFPPASSYGVEVLRALPEVPRMPRSAHHIDRVWRNGAGWAGCEQATPLRADVARPDRHMIALSEYVG
jgi:hypothetical protein